MEHKDSSGGQSSRAPAWYPEMQCIANLLSVSGYSVSMNSTFSSNGGLPGKEKMVPAYKTGSL